jgi:hypothetical protein
MERNVRVRALPEGVHVRAGVAFDGGRIAQVLPTLLRGIPSRAIRPDPAQCEDNFDLRMYGQFHGETSPANTAQAQTIA